MSERVPCIVPFCRRTAPREKVGDDTEIICGRHWRGIDRRWRRRHTMIARILKTREPEEFKNPVKAIRIADKIWATCKRQAIERAAGITA